jgi:dihydrofolate synthase / folylpolyglutamate synthase
MTEKFFRSHGQTKSLSQWLYYLENLHGKEIDLGLSRIAQVATRLAIDLSFAKVITVAGTNGKGTTCAFLENALLSEQKTVAVYSSPHIEYFNERLRFNKIDIDDLSLIQAFEQIEQARAEISLSYYEYTTLAAFLVLMVKKPQFIILEVGLGGRLDATNLIAADIMAITTIAIDHVGFLGTDRESIGFEKAGIMRKNKTVVIGDSDVPQSVLAHAKNIAAKPLIRDVDFQVSFDSDKPPQLWAWHYQDKVHSKLISPYIPVNNIATALMVLTKLAFNLTAEKINTWIAATKVAGRMELFLAQTSAQVPVLDQSKMLANYDVILDVAHNPQAALYLSEQLQLKNYGKVHGVVAMMADKDINAVLAPLTRIIDQWYLGNLTVERAATTEQLAKNLAELNQHYNCFDNISDGYKMACENANKQSQAQYNEKHLVLVFGSFFTVAAIRPLLVD